MPSFRFIAVAALAAVIAGAAPTSRAEAQTIELKLSHFVPPNHTIHKWAVAWAERIEKESGGRMKVTIYPNGQLVGPPQRQFDAARNGITDIAVSLHGVTPGRYPMTELGNLPFTWPKAGHSPAVTGKRMTELAPTYLAAEHQGLKILFMAVANPIVIFSTVPVRKVEDYKGLKVRYAGVQNRSLLDSMGAVPLLIQPTEAVDALSKGIVQGATFPYEAGASYDLVTVAKYAIEPPLATATFAFVMNPAKYASLPPDLKKLIDDTTGVKAAEEFGKSWYQAEVDGRKYLVDKGQQIITLPDADVEKIKKGIAPLTETALAALEKEGKPARKFYEEYTK
jgi:TRAP-type C4-dicarboxylate transport system substrate-binding protein